VIAGDLCLAVPLSSQPCIPYYGFVRCRRLRTTLEKGRSVKKGRMIVGQTEHEVVEERKARMCGICGSQKKMFFGNEDYNPTWFCPSCEEE